MGVLRCWSTVSLLSDSFPSLVSPSIVLNHSKRSAKELRKEFRYYKLNGVTAGDHCYHLHLAEFVEDGIHGRDEDSQPL